MNSLKRDLITPFDCHTTTLTTITVIVQLKKTLIKIEMCKTVGPGHARTLSSGTFNLGALYFGTFLTHVQPSKTLGLKYEMRESMFNLIEALYVECVLNVLVFSLLNFIIP